MAVKGDPKVIEYLNEALKNELTAINQYFIHHKMCEDWGYKRLSDKKREESIEEMRHADKIIERILFLDGIPNMQHMNPVRVVEDPIEQHTLDLQLESDAVGRLSGSRVKQRERKEWSEGERSAGRGGCSSWTMR